MCNIGRSGKDHVGALTVIVVPRDARKAAAFYELEEQLAEHDILLDWSRIEQPAQ